MTENRISRRRPDDRKAGAERGVPTNLDPINHHNGNDPDWPADTQQLPPHNDDAERAVLGGMLTSVEAVEAATATLTSNDFFRPAHATIYAAIVAQYAADKPIEPLAISFLLAELGELGRVGGGPYVLELWRSCITPLSTGYYAIEVKKCAAARTLIEIGTEFTQRGQYADLDQIDNLYSKALTRLEQAPLTRRIPTTAQRIDDFLAHYDEDDDHDWLIPDLLERRDRVILTGPEGGGKSTFGRQVAVMAAAGLHPFTGEEIPPVRVLILDLENSEKQLRRALRPLVIKAGKRLDPANLMIEVRLDGLNLHGAEDRAYIDQLVSATRPDLVITGPIYKMATGDPTEEKFAKPISEVLDRLRARHGCALWIEAHTAKAINGAKKRPIEPYGASLWLRWPEFGVHVSMEGDVEHWRGQREHRAWPSLMLRGGQWPWTPSTNDLEIKFRQIKNARFAFDAPMSVRDIQAATGIPKSTVARVLNHYRIEWAQYNAANPTGDDL